MIFREKLVNASTGEVRQGNVLDSSLGEVEQIMIDSSLCSVMYYWVKTPDDTWRKTQYYELVENLFSITYKVNDAIYQTYYLQEGDDVPVPEYTPATGYTWSGWLNENIPSKMPASDIVVESYTEQTDYAIIYYIDGRVVYSETHHYNDSITEYVPETREHYVFSGWSGFPQSGYMPAENVTVTGTYEEDQSYVLSYYVDASVYTQQSYMSNDVIDAPDDPQVEEGYSWSGWIDLPSLMPAYDSSVHSVLTANQYILDYYVDSSLWNSLIYNYKQNIVHQTYTPAEGYLFSGWVNEPETMPAINHYRVDGMTQLIPVLYNVYWYIDSSLIQTAQYESGTTVTSPVCEDSAYEYDWNGYDTFVMPSADTSIYGEKNIITYTVSWYIDSSLIQTGEYAPGSTVTSPLCQDPDYVYNWNGYDTFTMASADTTIFGTKESTQITIDTSLFGISLEQYGTSVEHPVVDFGYIYNNNGANFIAAQSSGIPGYIYIQKPNTRYNYNTVMEEIDSSIPATFKYQISSDGENWTDAVNVEFDTNVENKTTENNIVYLPELSSKVYVRLALKSIDTQTLTQNQITDGEYYSIMFGKIPANSKDTKSVFALDNKQTDSKYQVFGNYDAFYSRLTDQLNTIFNAQLKMHGLLLTIAYRICHAHNAYEHTAHNFITSGYRKWNDGFVINYPASCSIETAPVILPTATDVYKQCYFQRWNRCTKLTTPNNILPATILANECYAYMFAGCTSLVASPELPAVTLADACYMFMFSGCTALSSAPTILPAVTLADVCYDNMFAYCESLSSAPELPAVTLADACYMFMFRDCTALTSITSELPALTVPHMAYYSMFYNCQSLEQAPVIRGTSYDISACGSMFYHCSSLLHRAQMPENYDASTGVNDSFKDMYTGCTSLQD